jgi:hypothetical protein
MKQYYRPPDDDENAAVILVAFVLVLGLIVLFV